MSLEVYRKAHKAFIALHRVTKQSYPREEQYEMGRQIRRASLSVVLNIVEGYSKQESAEELKRYLRISIGSANEVVEIAQLSFELGYMDEEKTKGVVECYEEIARMLQGLRKAYD